MFCNEDGCIKSLEVSFVLPLNGGLFNVITCTTFDYTNDPKAAIEPWWGLEGKEFFLPMITKDIPLYKD